MRLTRRVAIGVALVCGGLAALLSFIYLQDLNRQRTPKAPPVTTKEVVVARANLPANTILTRDMLAVRKMELAQIPKLAVTEAASIEGYVAVEPLTALQPIARSQVMPRTAAFGLAGIVPPGMRAVTVAVDPVTGVAGLLKAGDRVDVVATFEIGETLVARTVLQDIELLALGGQTTESTAAEQQQAAAEQAAAESQAAKAAASKEGAKGAEKAPAAAKAPAQPKGEKAKTIEYPNATLAVTPEDAQKLLLAGKRGELQLALRPVGEREYVPVPGHDLASVVGPEYARLTKPKEEAKAAAAPAPAPAAQPPWAAAWAGGAKPETARPAKPETTKPEKRVPEVEVIRGQTRERVVP